MYMAPSRTRTHPQRNRRRHQNIAYLLTRLHQKAEHCLAGHQLHPPGPYSAAHSCRGCRSQLPGTPLSGCCCCRSAPPCASAVLWVSGCTRCCTCHCWQPRPGTLYSAGWLLRLGCPPGCLLQQQCLQVQHNTPINSAATAAAPPLCRARG